MSLEAISTEQIKRKLRNLQEHMPGQVETIYNFANFLADRLNPELNPLGFNVTAELALADMQKGTDGFTGNPLEEIYQVILHKCMQF